MSVGFVLVTLSPGYEKIIYRAFLNNDMVAEVNPLFGEYDFIIKVKGKTNKDIEQFVIDKIRAREGVIYTKTLMSSSKGGGEY